MYSRQRSESVSSFASASSAESVSPPPSPSPLLFSFVQFHLHLQLAAVARYARQNGVILMLELPSSIVLPVPGGAPRRHSIFAAESVPRECSVAQHWAAFMRHVAQYFSALCIDSVPIDENTSDDEEGAARAHVTSVLQTIHDADMLVAIGQVPASLQQWIAERPMFFPLSHANRYTPLSLLCCSVRRYD